MWLGGGSGGPAAATTTSRMSRHRAATRTARPARTPTTTSTARGSRSRTRSTTTGPRRCRRRPARESRGRAELQTFTGGVGTGCGQASADVGPFYCPTDQTIYLDTTFFDEVLEQQLGGPDGGFVEPYVLAHEYGHHIQNLLGTMGQVKTQQGPTSDAVRLELQADCYAGMWARAATTHRGRGRQRADLRAHRAGHPAGDRRRHRGR